jgi:hypothetical protein
MVEFEVNSVHDIAGIGATFGFESGALVAEEMSLDGTRSEGIPVWAATVLNHSAASIRAVIFYDVFDYLPAGEGPVANLHISSDPSIPRGTLLPLCFFDAPSGLTNEATDPTGIEIYDPDFNHGSILFGLGTISPTPELGDVNLNNIPYEIADLALMHMQLEIGIDPYVDEEQQAVASDVNTDLLPWTIADLLQIKDVVYGTLVPPPGGSTNDILHLAGDSIWYDDVSGAPTDTLEIPIQFSNGFSAGAVSFRFDYSTDDLSYVSYSTDGSRLPDEWDRVSVYERDGGLMFYAMPDMFGGSQDFPLPPGSGLFITLRFVAVNPFSTDIDFQFERLQYRGQCNGYATFQDDLWRFASLQQIDSDIGFSFIIGDADGTGEIDIDDVVYLIMYVFSEGPPPEPYESGDVDRNQTVDVDDITALLALIFEL